jgi:hypothetical protein
LHNTAQFAIIFKHVAYKTLLLRFLPSMHLKLGLIKNFVKAMNQEAAAFTYEKSSPE